MSAFAGVIEAERLHERLRQAKSKEEVAEIMQGASVGAFFELDERPGQFPGNYNAEDWYCWLRQLRNDPDSGLLEGLVR